MAIQRHIEDDIELKSQWMGVRHDARYLEGKLPPYLDTPQEPVDYHEITPYTMGLDLTGSERAVQATLREAQANGETLTPQELAVSQEIAAHLDGPVEKRGAVRPAFY